MNDLIYKFGAHYQTSDEFHKGPYTIPIPASALLNVKKNGNIVSNEELGEYVGDILYVMPDDCIDGFINGHPAIVYENSGDEYKLIPDMVLGDYEIKVDDEIILADRRVMMFDSEENAFQLVAFSDICKYIETMLANPTATYSYTINENTLKTIVNAMDNETEEGVALTEIQHAGTAFVDCTKGRFYKWMKTHLE